jgi:hypothetical protein
MDGMPVLVTSAASSQRCGSRFTRPETTTTAASTQSAVQIRTLADLTRPALAQPVRRGRSSLRERPTKKVEHLADQQTGQSR